VISFGIRKGDLSEILTIVGTLIGITNTFGAIVSILGPAVVGAVTNGNVRIIFVLRIYVGDWRHLVYEIKQARTLIAGVKVYNRRF